MGKTRRNGSNGDGQTNGNGGSPDKMSRREQKRIGKQMAAAGITPSEMIIPPAPQPEQPQAT
ncbi:hypothetical protein ACFL2D_02475, partial [Patescibacteria group bacterium]